MSLTDLGHLTIAAAYYVLFAIWLFLAVVTWRYRKPRDWMAVAPWLLGAAFFLGCGSHHVDFVYHHLQNEPIDYASWHHNAAVVMQVVGAPFFALMILPFVRDIARSLRP